MIYDITQPLFECVVFPGDPSPKKEDILRIESGDICNLTAFSMCAHNGTHVDAPRHFYENGKGISEIPLEKFIGEACVISHDGNVTADDARRMLECEKKKILIKGKATITLEAAKVFAEAGIDLIGNESQTIGPEDAPAECHYVLLKKEIVLLEGIRLAHVPDGIYMLNCAPINLGRVDGAPCRATLTDL